MTKDYFYCKNLVDMIGEGMNAKRYEDGDGLKMAVSKFMGENIYSTEYICST